MFTITTFDFRTGDHTYEVGSVWSAQDGPGPSWYETAVPVRGKDGALRWGVWPLGRDRDRAERVAALMREAIDGAPSEKAALKRARRAFKQSNH